MAEAHDAKASRRDIVLAIVFLSLTSLSVELWLRHHQLARFPLGDAAVWLVGGIVGLLVLLGRLPRRRLAAFPALFLACAAAALLGPLLASHAPSLTAAVQRAGQLLLAPAVLLYLPRGRARSATLFGMQWVGSGLGCVAVTQIAFGRPPWLVYSLFGDTQSYGAWMAVAVAIVVAQPPGNARARIAPLLLVLLATFTATSMLPMVGMACGLIVGRKSPDVRAWWPAVLGVAILGVVAAPRGQRELVAEAWRMTDVATIEELHERGAQIDSLRARADLMSLTIGGREMTLRSECLRPVVVPERDSRRHANFARNYVDQRFLELQAGLFAAVQEPVTGSGLGTYQSRVSANYLTFRKQKTLRPNTQNGWVVEFVETGIIGVLALLGLLSMAFAATRSSSGPDAAALRAGLLTIGIGAVAVPWFQTPLMLLFVLLCALALDLEPTRVRPPAGAAEGTHPRNLKA